MKECWERLACAIVLQAMEDYLTVENEEEREELESFFRSAWFAEHFETDPEELIHMLKEENPSRGIERCEALFESGELL